MTELRTERGLDRLVNFSDAAVAIAITLLILPSVDFAGEIVQSSLSTVLESHWATLFAFVLSFVVIGDLWLAHHQLFELIADYDYRLAWVNLVWLMAIVVLPFSTSLVANAGSGDRAVDAFYIGTIAVATASTLVMRLMLWRNPELLRREVAGELRIGGSLARTVTLVLALLIAAFVPGVGLYSLILLVAQGVISGRLMRAAQRRRPA